MFDKVHEMRTRIITSPSFTGDKVIGAILVCKLAIYMPVLVQLL